MGDGCATGKPATTATSFAEAEHVSDRWPARQRTCPPNPPPGVPLLEFGGFLCGGRLDRGREGGIRFGEEAIRSRESEIRFQEVELLSREDAVLRRGDSRSGV